MKNFRLKLNEKGALQIVFVVLILIGIAVTVYLVQVRHIFRSRASLNYTSGGTDAILNFTDNNGKNINDNCDDSTGTTINCKTDSSTIYVKFNPGNCDENGNCSNVTAIETDAFGQ